MQTNANWQIFQNVDQVAEAACEQIVAASRTAIADRGRFKLVLAGGSTPEKVYRLLSKADCEWSKWHVYFGDERCLPVDHADRNSMMAKKTLLENVPIPAGQIFVIPAERGPEKAAECYSRTVAEALPFDLVLLGMGEDGHTASLFPGHRHNECDLAHAVYNSPKPPPERVSVSARALSHTRQLIFLITGKSKQEPVKLWREGADLPVATINPDNPVDIYIDSEALPY